MAVYSGPKRYPIMFRILKVSGDSLQPRFCQGDYVLVSRLPVLFNTVRAGDVVAFRHPDHGTMIKIVDSVVTGEGYSVVGTHPRSIDSRHFGSVARSDLIGRVLLHLKRPAGMYETGSARIEPAEDNS